MITGMRPSDQVKEMIREGGYTRPVRVRVRERTVTVEPAEGQMWSDVAVSALRNIIDGSGERASFLAADRYVIRYRRRMP